MLTESYLTICYWIWQIARIMVLLSFTWSVILVAWLIVQELGDRSTKPVLYKLRSNLYFSESFIFFGLSVGYLVIAWMGYVYRDVPAPLLWAVTSVGWLYGGIMFIRIGIEWRRYADQALPVKEVL